MQRNLTRINNLIRKIDWSVSDLKEFGQLTGERFIKTGNLLQVGVDIGNIQQFMSNQPEISNKINSARRSKHFIEVVSLKIQLIDFYLGILINQIEGKTIPPKEYFSTKITRAKKYLPNRLYKKIYGFNMLRVKTIHGYVLGEISYKQIEKLANKFDNLPHLIHLCVNRCLAIKQYKNKC